MSVEHVSDSDTKLTSLIEIIAHQKAKLQGRAATIKRLLLRLKAVKRYNRTCDCPSCERFLDGKYREIEYELEHKERFT